LPWHGFPITQVSEMYAARCHLLGQGGLLPLWCPCQWPFSLCGSNRMEALWQ
jgi:hypothetical protein